MKAKLIIEGKEIEVEISEEEYKTKTGEIKTRIYPSAVRSIDKIRSGEYEILPLKKLENKETEFVSEPQFIQLTDNELPF